MRWSLKYWKRLTYLKLSSTPQRHPHCGETSLLNPYSNRKFWLLHLKAGSSTASFKPRDGLAQMMTQNSSFHSTTHMLSSQVSNPSHYFLKSIFHPFLPFYRPQGSHCWGMGWRHYQIQGHRSLGYHQWQDHQIAGSVQKKRRCHWRHARWHSSNMWRVGWAATPQWMSPNGQEQYQYLQQPSQV